MRMGKKKKKRNQILATTKTPNSTKKIKKKGTQKKHLNTAPHYATPNKREGKI